ncbi:MAG TPA: hypothetical protein VFR42_07445, partial [Candidatus Acidoferrum sp.]|nr:hypothetical protein [Candidatus Acidoferrum sp.]
MARITRYPAASISAQLRQLRNLRHGGVRLQKRCRASAKAPRSPVEVEFASRMVMFRLFYLGLTAYDSARHFLGLSELSWSKWTEDVRQRCGKEIPRRGMFPPREYFSEAAGRQSPKAFSALQ